MADSTSRSSASDQQASIPKEKAPADEARPGTQGTGEAVCPRCGGSGRVDGQACPACLGMGTVTQGIGGG